MATLIVEHWLEIWAGRNLSLGDRGDTKASVRTQAQTCAEAAKATGITMVALKQAAGGDLETYILRHNTGRSDATRHHHA